MDLRWQSLQEVSEQPTRERQGSVKTAHSRWLEALAVLTRPCVGVVAAGAAVEQNLLAQLCKVVLLQSSEGLR